MFDTSALTDLLKQPDPIKLSCYTTEMKLTKEQLLHSILNTIQTLLQEEVTTSSLAIAASLSTIYKNLEQ